MKQISVLLDFKKFLTYRTKRIASVTLVIFGLFSAWLFFLPPLLRLVYLCVFTGLTLISLSSMMHFTWPIIAQVKLSLQSRKYKSRIEVWPEIEKIAKRMGIEHSGSFHHK